MVCSGNITELSEFAFIHLKWELNVHVFNNNNNNIKSFFKVAHQDTKTI